MPSFERTSPATGERSSFLLWGAPQDRAGRYSSRHLVTRIGPIQRADSLLPSRQMVPRRTKFPIAKLQCLTPVFALCFWTRISRYLRVAIVTALCIPFVTRACLFIYSSWYARTSSNFGSFSSFPVFALTILSVVWLCRPVNTVIGALFPNLACLWFLSSDCPSGMVTVQLRYGRENSDSKAFVVRLSRRHTDYTVPFYHWQ